MLSPTHFREYVVRKERAKGHGDVSYMSRRILDQVFEEFVQVQLAQQDVLVAGEQALKQVSTEEASTPNGRASAEVNAANGSSVTGEGTSQLTMTLGDLAQRRRVARRSKSSGRMKKVKVAS